MTPAQAEWLRLAAPDGNLPRDWPAGRLGKQSRRRVDLRIVRGCVRQGWVTPMPRFLITEEGRAALARYGRDEDAAAAWRMGFAPLPAWS